MNEGQKGNNGRQSLWGTTILIGESFQSKRILRYGVKSIFRTCEVNVEVLKALKMLMKAIKSTLIWYFMNVL